MEHVIEEADLKTTPLIDAHRKLGAKLAPFGGWLMPIQYSGIIAEHNWCRSSVSLFDICHMGEFIISGDPAKNGFERIVTMNLNKMEIGTCRYGFMLGEDAGVHDDVIAYRKSADEWMLVVNAATTPGDEAHLKKHLAPGTNWKNISDVTAKLDIQGPLSREDRKSTRLNSSHRL